MQTKRLTLTEYRQQNAVWLANNHKEGEHIYQYIIEKYIVYITIYGLTKETISEIYYKCKENMSSSQNDICTITSEQIEEIISEHEAPIEHCHH